LVAHTERSTKFLMTVSSALLLVRVHVQVTDRYF